MGQMLDALRKLHQIDVQLYECRSRFKSKQQQIAQSEKRLASLTAEAAARKEAAQRQQVESDRISLDVKTREEHINKLRLALNSARTNKDYSTILSEINQLRADSGKQEETILQGMMKVEELKKQEAELQVQCDQIVKRLETLREELAAQQNALKGTLDGLEAERQAACVGVDSALLDRYSRISEYHEGDCMAEIITHGRGKNLEYVCNGCQMGLRVEQVNSLMTRDEIQICDSCGRMLYITHELAAK